MTTITPNQLKRLFPNVSRSTLAANSVLIPTRTPEPTMTIAPTTDAVKLNKTEQAYHEYLKLQSYPWVGVQCITLKLGDDCRYTPDFFCLNHGGELMAHEVKGFWRDDAKVKIKVAARMFPFIRFSVVMKSTETTSGWSHTPVKP